MWMHNGNIGAWGRVKRRLAGSIGDEWFNFVKGGTDSEWAFALFLDSLEKMGAEPSKEPPKDGGFGHVMLRKAMLETIRRINALIGDISEKERQGEDTRSLLNFAVTDGHSVVCTRYVNSRNDDAASLFWSSGTCWRDLGEAPGGKRDYRMERKDKGADIVLVASEPLTYDRSKFSIPLIFCRLHSHYSQLGHSTDKLYAHHFKTNRHDTSHQRRVLLFQSIS
jgi:glutamine amidotransferase